MSNLSVARNEDANIGCKRCPMSCGFSSSTAKSIEKHLGQIHDVEIDSQELAFPSLQDFYSWKVKMETETNSKFVKYRYDTNQKVLRFIFVIVLAIMLLEGKE